MDAKSAAALKDDRIAMAQDMKAYLRIKKDNDAQIRAIQDEIQEARARQDKLHDEICQAALKVQNQLSGSYENIERGTIQSSETADPEPADISAALGPSSSGPTSSGGPTFSSSLSSSGGLSSSAHDGPVAFERKSYVPLQLLSFYNKKQFETQAVYRSCLRVLGVPQEERAGVAKYLWDNEVPGTVLSGAKGRSKLNPQLADAESRRNIGVPAFIKPVWSEDLFKSLNIAYRKSDIDAWGRRYRAKEEALMHDEDPARTHTPEQTKTINTPSTRNSHSRKSSTQSSTSKNDRKRKYVDSVSEDGQDDGVKTPSPRANQSIQTKSPARADPDRADPDDDALPLPQRNASCSPDTWNRLLREYDV